MLLRVLLFLLLNFTALGIGSLFTAEGAQSDWYAGLHKAPWSPPGWTFGVAWSFIMICFAFYMAWLLKRWPAKKEALTFYGLQFILNVGWNPLFFYFHLTSTALVTIGTLTLLILYGLLRYWSALQLRSIALLPYLLWLLVATSLNAYVVLFNA